ncbi:MAG: class I SAM-dependent methyltransferase [Thermodesulfobacteriota bacterium]
MRPRPTVGRFLLKVGGFIQSLALVVMKPEDLIAFSRETYARPDVIDGWSRLDMFAAGLSSEERAALDKLPVESGKLLLLGLGGGREAMELARRGFQVSGVDFVPEMVEKALENARKNGVDIQGLVQEASDLDVPAASFDVVWNSVYSCIPTKAKRIEMLQRIRRALRPGGCAVCLFLWDSTGRPSRRAQLARKAFAFLTWGYRSYEPGDRLWSNMEFVHAFSSDAELRSEFRAAEFEVLDITVFEETMNGTAILRKS